MSFWWFLFGLGLIGTIIAHGVRQKRMIDRAPALETANGQPLKSERLIEKHSVSADVVKHYSSSREKLRAWGLCEGESRATLKALTAFQPWLLTAHAPSLTWADIYTMLHAAKATYDTHAKIFHVFDENCDRILYSISKADAQGSLPSPYDHHALRVAGEPVLLMLPLDYSRNADYDAFMALSSLACELIASGGRITTTSIDADQPAEQLKAADFERMAETIAHTAGKSPAGRLSHAA